MPNVCGSKCPRFERTLPFTRTYYVVVEAANDQACTGGKYALHVVSPGGGVPQLVADDVDASGLP